PRPTLFPSTTLFRSREQGLHIKDSDFLKTVEGVAANREDELRSLYEKGSAVQTRRKSIIPKTLGQKKYLKTIFKNDIVFGIGPRSEEHTSELQSREN